MNRSYQFRGHSIGLLTASCLCFLAISTDVQSQPQSFRPAQFGDNHLAQLEFAPGDMPRETDSVAVRCQGIVELDGTLSDYYCVTNNNYADREILAAVVGTIPEQTFVPASIDGENVRVVMNFALFIHCSSESCATVSARNHGYLLEDFGFDYIAPQPVLAGDDWYEGFDYKVKWIRDWMPDVRLIDNWPESDRVSFTMSAEIDTQGLARNVCLYSYKEVLNVGPNNWFGRVEQALERAQESMDRVRYIPGFHNNQMLTMPLYESSVLHVSTRGIPNVKARSARKIDCPSAPSLANATN